MLRADGHRVIIEAIGAPCTFVRPEEWISESALSCAKFSLSVHQGCTLRRCSWTARSRREDQAVQALAKRLFQEGLN